METHRIFLLSPAKCNGLRAQMLMREEAEFPTAVALRHPPGVPLGRVFTFLSGLYFRGKIAYARVFARPPEGAEGILVVTPSRGLVSPDTPITLDDLREFAEVDIAAGDNRYREPLARDVQRLASDAPENCEFVLLGSIATQKYLDILLAEFGSRLHFPSDFVGRGDMSRGGLMLRSAADREELTYTAVAGAIRQGSRPAKLPRRRYEKEEFQIGYESAQSEPDASSRPAPAAAHEVSAQTKRGPGRRNSKRAK